jgi:hypothetical protein
VMLWKLMDNSGNSKKNARIKSRTNRASKG